MAEDDTLVVSAQGSSVAEGLPLSANRTIYGGGEKSPETLVDE